MTGKHSRKPAGQRALVVGMGISGQSVSELLLRQGFQVTATDVRSREQFDGSLDRLEQMGCRLVLGGHDLTDFVEVDQIIVSPGVPLTIEPLREARNRGVEIVGELDWAWRQTNVPVVAVTGTNGKTTTTSIIGEIMKAAGKKTFVGGNIGTPLSQWILNGGEAEVLVLEVSSFQLDTATQFCPDVGVLLNITEDHLDRYESFSAYADSKLSLFARQNGSGSHVAILNGDDPICRRRRNEVSGRALITSRTDASADAIISGSDLNVKVAGRPAVHLSLDRCRLAGIHNQENILAAVLASAVLEVAPPVMQQVIDSYRGLPHRVEWVRTWKGIDFYDDSKGTNVGAVVKAVENFDRPVLLLLGGRDKLGTYAPIADCMARKGKGAFVFGEAAPRILRELEEHIPTFSFSNLDEALDEAVRRATAGDVVLLSPACSSFDQYASYAQRGDHFKSLVARLPDAHILRRQVT